MGSARKKKVETATARSNVYGLLAGVYRGEPSVSFLRHLRGPAFSATLEAIGLSPSEVFDGTSSDKLAEDLATEFTKLFIGPGPHLSPHESLHAEEGAGLEGTHWGPATVKVKNFMEVAGLTIDDSFPGMPDHISAEMEFMQRLAAKEAEAWADADEEFATNILRIEKRFFDEHLSRWVPSFCDKIIERSVHPFYERFAEMTKGFLEYEGGSLQAADAENVGNAAA